MAKMWEQVISSGPSDLKLFQYVFKLYTSITLKNLLSMSEALFSRPYIHQNLVKTGMLKLTCTKLRIENSDLLQGLDSTRVHRRIVNIMNRGNPCFVSIYACSINIKKKILDQVSFMSELSYRFHFIHSSPILQFQKPLNLRFAKILITY